MFAWISIALCIISMLVFVAIKLTKGGISGLIAKCGVSLIFVISGLIAILTNGLPFYAYFIFAGLLCGFVGDVLLGIFEKDAITSKNENLLNYGMLTFGIGHVFYMIALTFVSLQILDVVIVPFLLASGIGVVISLLIYVNQKTLNLNFGDFGKQSLAYSCFLVADLIYSLFLSILTKGMWLPVIALAFFLISDLILSYMYFGGKNTKQMDGANKVTYYVAQILFVVYLFFFI